MNQLYFFFVIFLDAERNFHCHQKNLQEMRFWTLASTYSGARILLQIEKFKNPGRTSALYRCGAAMMGIHPEPIGHQGFILIAVDVKSSNFFEKSVSTCTTNNSHQLFDLQSLNGTSEHHKTKYQLDRKSMKNKFFDIKNSMFDRGTPHFAYRQTGCNWPFWGLKKTTVKTVMCGYKSNTDDKNFALK